jgi:hypothetical protein
MGDLNKKSLAFQKDIPGIAGYFSVFLSTLSRPSISSK